MTYLKKNEWKSNKTCLCFKNYFFWNLIWYAIFMTIIFLDFIVFLILIYSRVESCWMCAVISLCFQSSHYFHFNFQHVFWISIAQLGHFFQYQVYFIYLPFLSQHRYYLEDQIFHSHLTIMPPFASLSLHFVSIMSVCRVRCIRPTFFRGEWKRQQLSLNLLKLCSVLVLCLVISL